MAQKMIDQMKILLLSLENKRDISTQTQSEFRVNLTAKRKFTVYYSKCYKDFVLSFSFSDGKNYIITRDMWLIFRKFIPQIDILLTKK